MAKIIQKGVVKRKAGMLYFIDAKGNLGEAKMAKGRKKTRKTKRK